MSDGMDGSAMDTGDIVGRSRERDGILGAKLSSRRGGGAMTEGGDVMAARVGRVGEWLEAGNAATRRGSSKVPRNGSECLIA